MSLQPPKICGKETSNSKILANVHHPFLYLWGVSCIWWQQWEAFDATATQDARGCPCGRVGDGSNLEPLKLKWGPEFGKSGKYTFGYLRIIYTVYFICYTIDNCYYCYSFGYLNTTAMSSLHRHPRSRSVAMWASKCCRTPSMVSIFAAWRGGIGSCYHLGMDQTCQ